MQSIHASQPAYEHAIADAAEQLARGSRFRWEREVLAVTGVVLVVDSILKLISLLYPEIGDRFIPRPWLMWSWLIWLSWSAWYLARIMSLQRAIIAKRLCLCCGWSLLDAATDAGHRGFCPDCGTPFNLGEYVRPAGCVMALKEARRRTREMFPTTGRPSRPPPLVPEPFYLYRNREHFDRVISRASTRIIQKRSRMPCVDARTLIVMLVLIGIGGVWLAGPAFGLLIPLMLPVAIFAVVAEMARASTMKARVCGSKLCLRCGYPLEKCRANENGGGVCPECGRPFHLQGVYPPAGAMARAELGAVAGAGDGRS